MSHLPKQFEQFNFQLKKHFITYKKKLNKIFSYNSQNSINNNAYPRFHRKIKSNIFFITIESWKLQRKLISTRMINVHRNITNIKHFFIVSTRLGLRLEFYWTQKKDKVKKVFFTEKILSLTLQSQSQFAVGKKPVLSRLCKRVEGPSASLFKQRGPHAPGPLFEGPATTLYTLFLRQMKNYATLNFANILLQCNSKFVI